MYVGIYYELPGAGGGNIEFANVVEASKDFEDIVRAYPDVYAAILVDGKVVREYNCGYKH